MLPSAHRLVGRVPLSCTLMLLASLGLQAQEPWVAPARAAAIVAAPAATATDLRFASVPSVTFNGLGSATFTCGSLSSTADGGPVTVEIWATPGPWSDTANEGFLIASQAVGTLATGASKNVSISATPRPVPEGLWYLTAVASRDGGIRATAPFARTVARLTDRWDLVDLLTGTFDTMINAGGFGVSIYDFAEPKLATGATAQALTVTYDMYGIPDRIDVRYGGTTVFTTGGYVSNGTTVTLPEWHPGDGRISVRMDGSTSGTAWQFRISAVASASPAITSPLFIRPLLGQPFTYTIAANRTITGTSAAAVPAWLTYDKTTGTLSGTPTATGSGSFTVGATVAGGSPLSTTVQWTVVDQGAPVIANAQKFTAWLGVPADLPITARNAPTAWNIRRTASGTLGSGSLDPGLSLGADGHITGTPQRAGSATVAVAAANAAGIGEATVGITVHPAPRITPPDATTVRVGHRLTGSFALAGGPVLSAAISGSVPGLTIADDGRVDGVPSTVGSYPVVFQGTNPAGSASAPWTLTVTPLPVPSVVTDPNWIQGNGGWWTNAATLALDGRAAVEAGSAVAWWLDGLAMGESAIAADGGFHLDLGALGEGEHTVETRFRDAYPVTGAPTTTVLRIDRTAPGVPLLTAPDLGLRNTATPPLGGTAEPGSTVLVRLGDAAGPLLGSTTAAADGSWNLTLGHLAEGPATLAVTVRDLAGNTSASASATVVVDTVPPILTLTWADAARTLTPHHLGLATSEPVTDLGGLSPTADNATLDPLLVVDASQAGLVATPIAPGTVRIRMPAVHDAAGNASQPTEILLLAPGDLSAFALGCVVVPVDALGTGTLTLSATAGTIALQPTGAWLCTLPIAGGAPQTALTVLSASDGTGKTSNASLTITVVTPVAQ